MAKQNKLIEIECPCCQSQIFIDAQTGAVIRYKEHEKPPSVADFETAVERLRGEAGRREEVFKKSVESHKTHADVLSKKFDEMLKLAKEDPDAPPPKRDIDFD